MDVTIEYATESPLGDFNEWFTEEQARAYAARRATTYHDGTEVKTRLVTSWVPLGQHPKPVSPMLWIAYDPMVTDHLKNREQFNGPKPAWGEPEEDFLAKQGVDVPQVGDELMLRMGRRVVYSRRLEHPEVDNDGRVTNWYWTVLVK